MKTYKLLNGFEFPAIGFGTWQISDEELKTALDCALQCGYTDLDTAYIYGNEQEIGDYLKQKGVDTKKLIITSKVWNNEHGYDKTMKAFERSEKYLGKVDTFLIHWPGKTTYIDTWKALQEIYKSGRVKVIGVSNFRKHHLQKLMEETEIVPMINQIETNPYMYDTQTIDFCNENKILVQAWSPLAHGGDIFKDETLKRIARKYNKSVSQVVLNYLVEKGICVLPKSKTPRYIAENFNIFDFSLDKEDCAMIAALNTGKRCGPDPDAFFEV